MNLPDQPADRPAGARAGRRLIGLISAGSERTHAEVYADVMEAIRRFEETNSEAPKSPPSAE
jgi:hypothetical protein